MEHDCVPTVVVDEKMAVFVTSNQQSQAVLYVDKDERLCSLKRQSGFARDVTEIRISTTTQPTT